MSNYQAITHKQSSKKELVQIIPRMQIKYGLW